MLGRSLDDSYPEPIRRNVTAVMVARLGANAVSRYVAPFLAVVASGLGVSIGAVGVAITVSELCGLLSPMIGRLVDGISRRRAMTVGLVGVALGAIVIATSASVLQLAVGLAIVSIFKMSFDMAHGAWITDYVAFHRRSRVVGLTEMSWAVGLLLGVSTMGLVTAAWSWRAGYATAAVAVFGLAAVIFRRIEPGTGAAVRSPAASSMLIADSASPLPAAAAPSVAALARLPAAGWFAVLAVLAMSASSQALFVTFGPWLEDSAGIGAAGLAAVAFGLGGVELMASTLSMLRTDRWGKERSVIGGSALMVATAVALLIADHWVVAGMVVIAVFIGAFEFCIVSAIPIGGDLVPGRPAAGLGFIVAATTLGRSITTIPATRLYEAHGIAGTAALAVVMAGGVTAAMSARLRTLRAR